MTSISIQMTGCILNLRNKSQFQVDLSYYIRQQAPVRFFREPRCEIGALDSACNFMKELYILPLVFLKTYAHH